MRCPVAKKAKRSTIEAEQRNEAMTPEERWAQHFPGIKAAKLELERQQALTTKANSAFRNALKSYKKQGGDVDALIEALRLQKMDPDEASRYMANINWTLVALGAPVGTQLGLFPSGETVAARVDANAIKANGAANGNGHARIASTKATIAAAKALGKKDAGAGKIGESPYERNSPEDMAWTSAWKTGMAGRIKTGLGRGKGKRPHGTA